MNNSKDFVSISIDGEVVRYNPQTGEIIFLTHYRNGSVFSPAQVYRTGRGVVKVRVDGATHRMMDVIHQHYHGGEDIRGFQGYPKNGDFSDLRAGNIIMVRTRESLFGGE